MALLFTGNIVVAMPTQHTIAKTNLFLALGFLFFVFAGFFLFFFPAFIIQPFRTQFPGPLALAMQIRQQAPLWTLVSAGATLIVAILLWQRISKWKKVLVVLGICLVSASAVMARVDYFEWMFHPLPAPGFESAAKSKLDSSEMMMAVRYGDDARAYPISIMAYHHIVNDVVEGVPIAVTY
jgi:hypothetical protein